MKKRLAYLTLNMIMLNSFACTTIIVGKKASQEGSILFGRNVDSSQADKAVHMVLHPRSGGYTFKAKENDFSYVMPQITYAYSGVPDWNTDNSWEENGFNEFGAAISATETIFSNPKTLALDPYVLKNGIGEEAIPSVILPQMTNALSGVKLLGNIIEKQGSSEGFGVVFADKNEVWYLENAGGHEWVAVRIPDDSYFVTANQGRIGVLSFKDTANVLSSPNLVQFATKHKLYNPQLDKEFNFSKVFSSHTQRDVKYNEMRVWTLQNKYTKSVKNVFGQGTLPVFLKPDRLLSVNDVEAGLQNYYQGTVNDPYTNQNPDETYRPISVFRTQQSHVLKLRDNLPLAIANVEYLAMGMTSLSLYIPFYQGVSKLPVAYTLGTEQADDKSAFWQFRKLETMAMLNFPEYAPLVHSAFAKFNATTMLKQQEIEKEYLALYKSNPQQAAALLNSFTLDTTNQAFMLINNLMNQIMTLETRTINKKYGFHGA